MQEQESPFVDMPPEIIQYIVDKAKAGDFGFIEYEIEEEEEDQ